MFLVGITLTIGAAKTVRFFSQRRKLRGTVCFAAGFLLVLSGYTFVGVLVESFGFINLFGDFFPVVIGFLRSLPVIGPILSAPGVSKLVDWIGGGGGSLPV